MILHIVLPFVALSFSVILVINAVKTSKWKVKLGSSLGLGSHQIRQVAHAQGHLSTKHSIPEDPSLCRRPLMFRFLGPVSFEHSRATQP